MSTAAERAKRRRAKMTPQQRTQERTFYAKKRRDDLIRLLSPTLTCAAGCGFTTNDPAELIVDHVDGKAWRAARISAHARAARYWREYKAGVPMRALCAGCSNKDGALRRHGTMLTDSADDEVPF